MGKVTSTPFVLIPPSKVQAVRAAALTVPAPDLFNWKPLPPLDAVAMSRKAKGDEVKERLERTREAIAKKMEAAKGHLPSAPPRNLGAVGARVKGAQPPRPAIQVEGLFGSARQAGEGAQKAAPPASKLGVTPASPRRRPASGAAPGAAKARRPERRREDAVLDFDALNTEIFGN